MTWTGTLVAPATGLYRLGVKGVDCELFIDGQSVSVAKRAGFMPGLPKFKTMRLEALHRYDVRVVAAGGGFAAASLLWSRVSETPEEDAKAAAARADVVVAVVGITSDLEGEESPVTLPGFQGGDRTTLDLPAEQTQLLEAVRSTGKPLVIVTMNGSALNLEWAKQNASAILEAWYPGQAGGSVVGSILSGAVNPSGRLPITFYRDVSDLPPFDDYRMANRTYRYFKGTPLYPFGYGLSFTNFSYGPLKLTPAGDGYRVTGTVTNVGKLGGDEVVQLYLKFPSLPGAPRIALRGVQRVHLEPGDRRSVRFELSPRDLSSVTPQGRHRVAPGAYVISVGGGQPGTGVAGSQLRFAIHETIPVSG
jgi:beta-glucosidase